MVEALSAQAGIRTVAPPVRPVIILEEIPEEKMQETAGQTMGLIMAV